MIDLAGSERRSFTQAAKRLGVSTSVWSHAIRGLEEQIGVSLLARATQRRADGSRRAILIQLLSDTPLAARSRKHKHLGMVEEAKRQFGAIVDDVVPE
jgi:molybdenum-dependent DNA-binding transcriptional regulator ModE